MKLVYTGMLAPILLSITHLAMAAVAIPDAMSLEDLDTSFIGENPGDQFGYSMAFGDLNSDGAWDLIVGAPSADGAAGEHCGKVYIFFGQRSEDGFPWVYGTDAANADVIFEGAQAGDYLGHTVTEVGDVLYRDYFNDLAIAATGADGGNNSGRVYLVSGRNEGWVSGVIDEVADTSFVGPYGERIGYSMSRGGDINGDGYQDFLVGSFRHDIPGGDAWAGRAFIIFGRPPEEWPESATVEEIAGASFVGEAYNELLGWSVAGNGNLNGDAFTDVVIGSPGDVGANSMMGRVSVLLGKRDGWQLDQPISEAATTIFTGEMVGSQTGYSVVMTRDYDYSGSDELVIGAPTFTPSSSEPNVGKVYLIRGRRPGEWPTGEYSVSVADGSWLGEAPGDYAGVFVGRGGNIDRDGKRDLAVGAYLNDDGAKDAGKAYVIFLTDESVTPNSSLAQADIQLLGFDVYGRAGASVLSGDSFDGDRFDDLLIAAPRVTPDGVTGYVGNVYLLRGVLLQDQDYDGYSPATGDCDDEDPARNPGAEEIPYDWIDQDCNGEDLADVDGDGYLSWEVDEDDCDDYDPNISPEAHEVCDGRDNDCDTLTDENVQTPYYRDADGDGFGTPDDEVLACEVAPEGYVAASGDCDDTNPAVNPSAIEVCGDSGGDGVDDDCSGTPDDRDFDGDGSVDAACGGDDCDDFNPDVHPGAVDTPYDGFDQDCDGSDFVDVDGDGFAATAASGPDCNDDDPTIYPGAPEVECDGIDQNCDGVDLYDVDGDGFKGCGLEEGEEADCDDYDPDTYPGAYDWGNDDKDQNCDGIPAQDADEDGYRTPDDLDCDDYDSSRHPGAEEDPYDGVDQDCDGNDLVDVDLDGFAATQADGDDCDDNDQNTYPGADEIPYDGIDQDCNGSDLVDVDGDGFDSEVVGGDDCDDNDISVSPIAPEVPYNNVDENCDGLYADQDADGYNTYDDINPDCDDLDPDAYPGAEEIPYDGIDQDCDGADLTDMDGDGFDGWEAGGADCDDLDPTINPDAEEILDDGIDNNCDNLVDPADMDGDGYSIAPSALEPDCDDSNPDVHPGATEVPDLVDNDCDGRIDEHIVEAVQDPGGCVCSSRSGTPSGGDVLPFVPAALLLMVRLRRRRLPPRL